MPLGDVVKGTPFENQARRRSRARRASSGDGQAGRRRPGAEHQRVLVVRGEGPRPRARDLHRAERGAGAVGEERIRIDSSRWRRCRCSFPSWPRRSCRTRSRAWRARRDARRPRQRRRPVAAEVRPVLGEGRRDERARLHAPRRVREHHPRQRLPRPRRPRQHHGQPARDDLLPVAPDLRRRLRPPSAAAASAAPTPAATCRRTSAAPKWRATCAATRTARTRSARRNTCGRRS